MKRNVLAALLMVSLLVTAGNALAVSGAGAINLIFPVGARYNAMGEAGTALAQDATAIWWNPGGMAYLRDNAHPVSFHFMQSPLAEGLANDIGLYWLGYATPVGDSGLNVGGALNYLSMGEQQQASDDGTTGDTFKSYMFALSVAASIKVAPNLGIGIGVKYFGDSLAPDWALADGHGGSGYSFGVDAGLLWKPHSRLNVGAAISNLGPAIQHVDAQQKDPMPRKFSSGIAANLYHSEAMSVLVVGDYLVPLVKWDNDNEEYGVGVEAAEREVGAGLEWSYVNSLFFRLGYKWGTGDIEDMTYGFGIDMNRWLGRPLSFEFAEVPQAKGLDKVKRFSFAIRF